MIQGFNDTKHDPLFSSAKNVNKTYMRENTSKTTPMQGRTGLGLGMGIFNISNCQRCTGIILIAQPARIKMNLACGHSPERNSGLLIDNPNKAAFLYTIPRLIPQKWTSLTMEFSYSNLRKVAYRPIHFSPNLPKPKQNRSFLWYRHING